MFPIHFSKLKCDYYGEISEAIRRYGDLCRKYETFDRTAILDDDEYRVLDLGRDIGQMRGYELQIMLAQGKSFLDSEFADPGPHLVHVKQTGEHFYVVGAQKLVGKRVTYLCDKRGKNRRLVKDERLDAL